MGGGGRILAGLAVLAILPLAAAACHPDCTKEEDVLVSLSMTSDLPVEHGSSFFDGDVVVGDVAHAEGQWDVDLSGTDFGGEERSMHLAILSVPPVDLDLVPGETVTFQYVHDEPLWANSFAGIWRDGRLLVAVMDQAMAFEGNMRIEPLFLESRRGFCAQVSDDCGAHERVGMRVTGPDGRRVLVMDHGMGTLLGDRSYRILVEEARLNYESLFMMCTDRPWGWLRALVADVTG